MVVFQDGPVVVEESQLCVWVDVELVVGSGMVEVVDQGGDQTGKHLQVGQPVLENSKFKSLAKLVLNLSILEEEISGFLR